MNFNEQSFPENGAVMAHMADLLVDDVPGAPDVLDECRDAGSVFRDAVGKDLDVMQGVPSKAELALLSFTAGFLAGRAAIEVDCDCDVAEYGSHSLECPNVHLRGKP